MLSANEDGTKNLKCVIIGDNDVGKSTTCFTIQNGPNVPFQSDPKCVDNFVKHIQLENEEYNIGIWDSECDEEYDRLRPLSYPETNVFVIMFSVIEPESFTNVTRNWYPEIQEHAPGSRILLVGNKTDIRQIDSITRVQGEELCRELKLDGYLEISAATGDGLDELLEEIPKAVEVEERRNYEEIFKRGRVGHYIFLLKWAFFYPCYLYFELFKEIISNGTEGLVEECGAYIMYLLLIPTAILFYPIVVCFACFLGGFYSFFLGDFDVGGWGMGKIVMKRRRHRGCVIL